MTDTAIVIKSRALLDELVSMSGYAKNRLLARQRKLHKEVAAAPACQQAASELEQIDQQLAGWHERKRTLQTELMAINGVTHASCITPEVHALVLRRLADGFKVGEVALMAGCAHSTVISIQKGRYRLSKKPPEVIIGARGRSWLNR